MHCTLKIIGTKISTRYTDKIDTRKWISKIVHIAQVFRLFFFYCTLSPQITQCICIVGMKVCLCWYSSLLTPIVMCNNQFVVWPLRQTTDDVMRECERVEPVSFITHYSIRIGCNFYLAINNSAWCGMHEINRASVSYLFCCAQVYCRFDIYFIAQVN